MAIWELRDGKLAEVPATTFASEQVLERRDLQALIRDNIQVIAPDTMVLAEEYGDWTDSRRRIDLLGWTRAAIS